MINEILSIKDLKVTFKSQDGFASAVDGLSIQIHESEIIGIVGESGSGKSVTALSIMRLIPNPPGKIDRGKIIFKGSDLLSLTEKEMRKIRGNKISMISQEPGSALNPVYNIGNQISESLILHQGLSKKEALRESIEILRLVGIPSPEQRVKNFPHQLSGGMCQRVMIAIAMSCKPSLLLADEPTTALDVTIQKQILKIMKEMIEARGTSIILITHNLGVISEMADNVVVMYAGKPVEISPMANLFERPMHPYTKGLINAIPRSDQKNKELIAIPGLVPSLFELPKGCTFHNRCSQVQKKCMSEPPPIIEVDEKHLCSCWLYR